MKAEKNILGIYVHIPFCVQKCKYCDFLSFSCDTKTMEVYADALCREAESLSEKYPPLRERGSTVQDYVVSTIYFGGGTPSLFPPALLSRILCKLKGIFVIDPKAEITLEANPGTLTKKKLAAYYAMGINRLSIGLQSAEEEELKLLGRIHTWETFRENYEAAREAGFSNINIDLMTALPGQTKEKLARTLEKVLPLKPEHISAYSLILEEGTPFYETYGGDCTALPDEDTERALYYFMRDLLVKNGYFHYEISNFARPGYESRHNSAYWKRQNYIGLGLGASSLFHQVRYRNEGVLSNYIGNPWKIGEQLSIKKTEQMEEFLFLGLRLLRGVSAAEFYETFSVSLFGRYGDTIEKLLKEDLLCRKNERFALTDRGIDYGNYVFSTFLFE